MNGWGDNRQWKEAQYRPTQWDMTDLQRNRFGGKKIWRKNVVISAPIWDPQTVPTRIIHSTSISHTRLIKNSGSLSRSSLWPREWIRSPMLRKLWRRVHGLSDWDLSPALQDKQRVSFGLVIFKHQMDPIPNGFSSIQIFHNPCHHVSEQCAFTQIIELLTSPKWQRLHTKQVAVAVKVTFKTPNKNQ